MMSRDIVSECDASSDKDVVADGSGRLVFEVADDKDVRADKDVVADIERAFAIPVVVGIAKIATKVDI